MPFWGKKLLELAISFVICYIGMRCYYNRLEKKPTHLRLYLVLEWCVLFVVMVVMATIFEELGCYTEEFGNELCSEVISFVSIVWMIQFFFCYRNQAGIKMSAIIHSFSKINETGKYTIDDDVIKKRDFEGLKEHVIYILNSMQEELKQFADHSIDWKLERRKKQYCLSLRYRKDPEDIEEKQYQNKMTELKEYLESLKERYEVTIHSEDSCTEGKIYIS